MAIDHIAVTRSSGLGMQTVRLALNVAEARELCDKLLKVANHCFDVGDYATLEARFGLATGAGSNFLTLLTLLNEILNLTTTVTGADRQARLDEFTARLTQ